AVASLLSHRHSLSYPLAAPCVRRCCVVFVFNDTATTEIYTLSLHDALPIFIVLLRNRDDVTLRLPLDAQAGEARSEEHTSELQSLAYLVCRLLLEKTHTNKSPAISRRHTTPSITSKQNNHTHLCTSSMSRLTRHTQPESAPRPQPPSFFFNDPAPPEIYPLPLHAALPI